MTVGWVGVSTDRPPFARRGTMPACASDSGGVAGFGELLLGEAPSLLRYARRLARSVSDAEDLLQDTMLRCWRGQGGFEPGSNFGGWTRAVMRNAFLNTIRRHRFEVDVPDETLHRAQALPPSQGIGLELRDAWQALDRLPEGQRKAVVMTIDGVSMEDGAMRLAIPLNTYKSWLHRGRARLMRLVEGDERGEPVADAGRVSRPVAKSSRQRDWAGVMIG